LSGGYRSQAKYHSGPAQWCQSERTQDLPCQIAAGKGLFAPIHPSYNPDNERNQNANNYYKHDRPHPLLALVTRQPWKQDFAQFFHKLQAMLATHIGFSDYRLLVCLPVSGGFSLRLNMSWESR
jgi:hypothetical protein